MPQHIRSTKQTSPIIARGSGVLERSYFDLIRLQAGEMHQGALPEMEAVCVVMSGVATIDVDGSEFAEVGQRDSVWQGMADSVYVPTGARFEIRALTEGVEVAIAGGACDDVHAPFRVTPDEVDVVTVGSVDTHSMRRICHILGGNAAGRAGNLLVSELYCEAGCWSGYPPHKHDQDREGETAHEEVYHYRFDPDTGFGGQFCYSEQGTCEVYKTGHGDTVAIDGGYHPTVTSPGHREYIFTILVGRRQRSLIQHFHEEQAHLMSEIPGIDAMREKFKS